MRQKARVLLIVVIGLCPRVAVADEDACAALGHLLLASDLMRIAADAGGNLETTYGPSIGASIRSSASVTEELQQRAPEKFNAIRALREIAATALAFASAGRIEVASLEDTGRTVAEDARQLYVDWTCDDPEPGPGNGDLTGGEDGERDPSAGGIGRGGAASFRAVWIALGNENRVERAVLLGCFVTAAILLPYLVLRDRRNRRRAERHFCASPTSIVIDEARRDVRFFDISSTGARLILGEILPPGTALMVEVAGEDVEATVVRSGTGFAGIQFAQPLSEDLLQEQLEIAQKAMQWSSKAARAAAAQAAAKTA